MEVQAMAGFQATGIYPLNSQYVMKKLFDRAPSDILDAGFVSQEVIRFAKECREGTGSSTTRRKREVIRMQVEAGKSIFSVDFQRSEPASKRKTQYSSSEKDAPSPYISGEG